MRKMNYTKNERKISFSLVALCISFVLLFGTSSSIALYGQTPITVTLIPGTTTWQCPAGVTSISVEMWGAGGAGGGTSSNTNTAGGGGAGGSYVKNTDIAVTPGTTYNNINIGVGGAGVSGAGTGGSGGNTTATFGIAMTAVGGAGGTAGVSATQSGIGGEAALTGNSGYTEPYSYYGTEGETGNGKSSANGGYGGAGGAAAGDGGAGGVRRIVGGNGNDGTAPGGGGSGGYSITGSVAARKGGKGGNGQIKITYTTPYRWNKTGTASWTTASNWTPVRTTPAITDILLINSGGSVVLTDVPTLTIAQLLITNNSNVELQSSAASTLTIAGSAGDDFVVAAGSTLNLSGLNTGAIVFSGTDPQTITVNGTLTNAANTSYIISNAAGVNIASNIAVPSLTINFGGILNVNAGKQLTVATALSNSGTLNLRSTLADGTATIITNGTVSNGTYNVEQYLNGARNWYVSSPLNDAKAPAGNTYFSYDETGNNTDLTNSGTAYWKPVYGDVDPLTAGVGYIAKPSTAGLITFSTTTGKLNTGDVTLTLTWSGATSKGFNLIGNPYPSHLTWTRAFVDAVTAPIGGTAPATLIEPTIWIRTNSGSVNSGVGANWSFNTYNALVNEIVPSWADVDIAPMQAFWVKAKVPGTLILTSDLTKSHNASNRLKAPAVKNTNRQRLRLQVDNGSATDEALIYFDTNASNGYDQYDSPKMSNASAAIPEIYTTVGTEKLVINGLNNIPLNTELPLGFTTGQSNTFTIKATEFSNFDPSVRIFIKDNVSATENELTDGTAYSFNSDVVSNSSRFSVIFKSASIIAGLNQPANLSNVFVFANQNGQITISKPNGFGNNDQVSIYNILGHKLASTKLTGSTTVLEKNFASGAYLVTLNVNGEKRTEKVIIK